MKFREWMNQVSKQRVALSEVSESLYADGHSITVTVKAGGVTAEIDGRENDIRYLRPFFTHHKDEFEAMLEAIVERCRELSTATEIVMSVAAYDAIPGAVIERLKGNDPGDNINLIKASIEKKSYQLQPVLSKIDPIFNDFTFDFQSFGDYRMRLTKSHRGVVLRWGNSELSFQYGKMERTCFTIPTDSSITDDLTELLLFVGNFEVVKARLEEFYRIIAQTNTLALQE